MGRHDALLAVIQALDPAGPNAIAGTYATRPTPTAEKLAILLEAQGLRVMLMGQTGVGKTTEIRRLEALLADRYTVLLPPVDQTLDLSQLGWHDLLAFSAVWGSERLGLARTAEDTNLRTALQPREVKPVTVTKPIVDERLWQTGLGFGSPSLRQTTETRQEESGGPPPPTVSQRFRNDHAAVRATIELGKAQIWDLTVGLLKAIERATQKPIVLLLDGLEKMPGGAARRLFQEGGRCIEELPCRAVVTAPLGLSFDRDFVELAERFSLTERLRAVRVTRPGNEGGRDFLMELAQRRGAATVFGVSLLDYAIVWSGGLPRQFLKLLRDAAMLALADGQEHVEQEHLTRARQRETERFQYQLQPQDFSALDQPDAERNVGARANLLALAALLEYDAPGGGLLIEINPLVKHLLGLRNEARHDRAS